MSIYMRDFPNREEWLKARKDAGIGASEVATACGANPYETSTELWKKRTGLQAPTQTNENMERGHRLEPVVRERFMSLYGNIFDLQYDEFGMWFNDDYPAMFATLDGILTSKVEGVYNIGGIDIELHVGEKMIYEVKNPAPTSRQAYFKWETKPNIYVYQAVAQMMCTGIRKHLLHANITGEFAQCEHDERYFFTDYAQCGDYVSEIAQTIPAFFEMQKKAIVPPQAVDLAEVVLSAVPKVGDIITNFDEVKASITATSKRYEGLTFSEDTAKDARKTSADLNKAIKQIDEIRTATKKTWEAPLEEFEAKCKVLKGVIENVKKPIDDQIKTFEESADKKKKQLIEDFIKGQLETTYNDLKLLMEANAKNEQPEKLCGVPFNKRWLNTTMSMKTVQKDITDYFGTVRKEYAMLYSLKDNFDAEMWNAIYAEYLASGLSVARALAKKAQILDARETQRKAEEAMTKKSAPAVEPTQPTLPLDEPKREPEHHVTARSAEDIKPITSKKIYTMCVEFSHTDLKAFGDLVEYLKKNGFSCREIKDYSK